MQFERSVNYNYSYNDRIEPTVTRIWKPNVTDRNVNSTINRSLNNNVKVSLEHHKLQPDQPRGFNSGPRQFGAPTAPSPMTKSDHSQVRSEVLKMINENNQRPYSQPKGLLPNCFCCGRSIVGVMVTAFDLSLHSECFQCSTCGTNLANQGHHFLNDKFYCDVHGSQIKSDERQDKPKPIPTAPLTQSVRPFNSSANNSPYKSNNNGNGPATRRDQKADPLKSSLHRRPRQRLRQEWPPPPGAIKRNAEAIRFWKYHFEKDGHPSEETMERLKERITDFETGRILNPTSNRVPLERGPYAKYVLITPDRLNTPMRRNPFAFTNAELPKHPVDSSMDSSVNLPPRQESTDDGTTTKWQFLGQNELDTEMLSVSSTPSICLPPLPSTSIQMDESLEEFERKHFEELAQMEPLKHVELEGPQNQATNTKFGRQLSTVQMASSKPVQIVSSFQNSNNLDNFDEPVDNSGAFQHVKDVSNQKVQGNQVKTSESSQRNPDFNLQLAQKLKEVDLLQHKMDRNGDSDVNNEIQGRQPGSQPKLRSQITIQTSDSAFFDGQDVNQANYSLNQLPLPSNSYPDDGQQHQRSYSTNAYQQSLAIPNQPSSYVDNNSDIMTMSNTPTVILEEDDMATETGSPVHTQEYERQLKELSAANQELARDSAATPTLKLGAPNPTPEDTLRPRNSNLKDLNQAPQASGYEYRSDFDQNATISASESVLKPVTPASEPKMAHLTVIEDAKNDIDAIYRSFEMLEQQIEEWTFEKSQKSNKNDLKQGPNQGKINEKQENLAKKQENPNFKEPEDNKHQKKTNKKPSPIKSTSVSTSFVHKESNILPNGRPKHQVQGPESTKNQRNSQKRGSFYDVADDIAQSMAATAKTRSETPSSVAPIPPKRSKIPSPVQHRSTLPSPNQKKPPPVPQRAQSKHNSLIKPKKHDVTLEKRRKTDDFARNLNNTPSKSFENQQNTLSKGDKDSPNDIYKSTTDITEARSIIYADIRPYRANIYGENGKVEGFGTNIAEVLANIGQENQEKGLTNIEKTHNNKIKASQSFNHPKETKKYQENTENNMILAKTKLNIQLKAVEQTQPVQKIDFSALNEFDNMEPLYDEPHLENRPDNFVRNQGLVHSSKISKNGGIPNVHRNITQRNQLEAGRNANQNLPQRLYNTLTPKSTRSEVNVVEKMAKPRGTPELKQIPIQRSFSFDMPPPLTPLRYDDQPVKNRFSDAVATPPPAPPRHGVARKSSQVESLEALKILSNLCKDIESGTLSRNGTLSRRHSENLKLFDEEERPFKRVPINSDEVNRLSSAFNGLRTRGPVTKPQAFDGLSRFNQNEDVLASITASPTCYECKKVISGSFVKAAGKTFCPEHFNCANGACNRRLIECGFVEENGKKYCEKCFETLIAPDCAKCGLAITAECLNALQKHWHPQCFTCTHCRQSFGNAAFYVENNKPYCERDWNQLFTAKCTSCCFPIEAGDKWIEALNGQYHTNCFNCTVCHCNLEGQTFYAREGRPFCKSHS